MRVGRGGENKGGRASKESRERVKEGGREKESRRRRRKERGFMGIVSLIVFLFIVSRD